MNNQKGITLVELLAAISIMAIISVILWGIFYQGNTFTQKKISENQLSQEVNTLARTLQTIHQKGEPYSIIVEDCKIVVNEKSLEHPYICFDIQTFLNKTNENMIGKTIEPTIEEYHSLTLTIIANDKKYPEQTVILPVRLYRLKEK